MVRFSARFSVPLLAATSLFLLAPAAHAVNDGSPEAYQKAREACKKDLADQKTASKNDKELLWQRCMQTQFGGSRRK